MFIVQLFAAPEMEAEMNHLQRYLVDEFAEDYQDGRLSKRDALKLIASVTGSILQADSFLSTYTPPLEENLFQTPTVSTITPVMATDAASAKPASGMVMPDDPDIEAGALEVPAPDTSLKAYLARPSQKESTPVVLVCHENRGLTPYIRDVVRRVAKAGYVGLAVDLLSRQGGTEAVGSENVPGTLGNIDPNQFVRDFVSGWTYLKGQSFARAERVGMVGFCFGGGVTWLMATAMPELLAAVPFYGPPPPLEKLAKVNAAVLAIYGGLDQRITSSAPAVEEAMHKNNKVFEKVIYPDADHAFHNDTGSRYNPEAAQDAWSRTLAWFERYLK
jgi:carboxymethylenebutenolidase